MPIRRFLISFILITIAFSVQAAHATAYTPNGDIIGTISHYTVHKRDTLYSIGRRFDIGIVEILAANPGINPWRPKEGTVLTLPTAHILPSMRKGLVLNLAELRLFYFADDGTVMTFPIGIGREGWQTPTGTTTVVLKRKDPTWIPPESIREENPNLPDIIPPGPNNPLGKYALNLGWEGIRIHGTNQPSSIGKRSSHGCIRLYPEDIETLFNTIDIGTPVTIIDTPYKLGWQGDTLFLEVTPTQAQTDVVAAYRRPKPDMLIGLNEAIAELNGNAVIDWKTVDRTAANHSGLPTVIGKETSDTETEQEIGN